VTENLAKNRKKITKIDYKNRLIYIDEKKAFKILKEYDKIGAFGVLYDV
jgi:hypothetical protein